MAARFAFSVIFTNLNIIIGHFHGTLIFDIYITISTFSQHVFLPCYLTKLDVNSIVILYLYYRYHSSHYYQMFETKGFYLTTVDIRVGGQPIQVTMYPNDRTWPKIHSLVAKLHFTSKCIAKTTCIKTCCHQRMYFGSSIVPRGTYTLGLAYRQPSYLLKSNKKPFLDIWQKWKK